MTQKALYKGASFDTNTTKGFALSDVELIKKDIRNNLSVKKRTRRMMADWGTDIQLQIGEQQTPLVKNQIAEEVQIVIDNDPRVSLLRQIIDEDKATHQIKIQSFVFFIELGITDVINLDFDLT